MTTKTITAPTLEPITLTQAKNYLRVDFSTDDTFITDCITRARRTCEHITGRALYTQTLQSIVETDSNIRGAFSGARTSVPYLYLPYSPVQSISSISYESDRNVWTDTPTTNFSFDIDEMPCSIVLNRGIEISAIPTINGTYRFKVVYIAGQTAIADISSTIITAMYMYLSAYYTNRNNEEATCTAQCLLLQEKIYRL